MFTSNLIVVLICLCGSLTNAEFPNDPKPCKYGDSECIIKLANYYMIEKSQGDDSLNLASTDPLFSDTISIKQGANSPVNIHVTFTNSNIVGLKNSNFYKVRGFGKNLTRRHELRVLMRQISIIGDYNITGKVLILPIRGAGKSNMTMVNADVVMHFTGTPIVKDDGTYMQIDDMKFAVKPERLIFNFENLFNDKLLSDNMNLFLNENWRDITDELYESLIDAFRPICRKVINDVFSKYPYEKYFTE